MSDRDDDLMAIPRLAEHVGVTPRVIRYWEEQGLISPTREHGKLRYSPRDLAIARLVKRLIDAGVGIEGIAMLKAVAEREVRLAGRAGDERALLETALRLLYQRKAFREETGRDEEHYPEGPPPPPPGGPGPHGGPPPPPPHGSLGPSPPPDPPHARGAPEGPGVPAR
ncbi:MAG TPA: helix-turn-helix domain-containing protein [Actinomycetota bacterium]|nr:helix-turn-helix domain-containing protein [Actinomycetota bacterium]